MVVESIAILAISLCMVVVFLRSQRADYALSIIPITFVPFMHLVALLILRYTDHLYPQMSFRIILAFVNITALAIACLLMFFFSTKIKSRKNKSLYLIVLCGYSVVLTCAYVYYNLSPLFI